MFPCVVDAWMQAVRPVLYWVSYIFICNFTSVKLKFWKQKNCSYFTYSVKHKWTLVFFYPKELNKRNLLLYILLSPGYYCSRPINSHIEMERHHSTETSPSAIGMEDWTWVTHMAKQASGRCFLASPGLKLWTFFLILLSKEYFLFWISTFEC